jgi:Carboxypeptidase regulatory-like domain
MRHNFIAKILSQLISAGVLLACCSIVAHGQGSTASLAGVVHDQQGLIVRSASVRISGTENSFARTVITGTDGAFEFAGLLPGDYKMTVDLQGFTREEINVAIAVNQRVRLDVVLKAGGVAQQVEVATTVRL